MKIVVTAREPDLNSDVDPRFGRAAFFLLVDTESSQWQAINNNATNASSGAGIAAAQAVIEAGAGAVLTGNCGPNAFRTLQAGDVQVYTDVVGTVEKAVKDFNDGLLQPVNEANVDSHSGTGLQG
ncbi:MAG: hypothetical protein JXA82_02165 [Sedimentisphaerales bacterium]|nr:hypothetical protein [Sedimentisphaerales bacterium]